MARVQTLDDLKKVHDEGGKQLYPEKTRIAVGLATCGKSSGGGKVYEEIARQIERTGLDAILTQTGCIGFCQREPLVDVAVAGGPRVLYENVTPERARDIVAALAKNEVPAEGALCRISTDHALVTDSTVTYAVGDNGLSRVPFFEASRGSPSSSRSPSSRSRSGSRCATAASSIPTRSSSTSPGGGTRPSSRP
jgi:(2Fe-2S) ferredoxin